MSIHELKNTFFAEMQVVLQNAINNIIENTTIPEQLHGKIDYGDLSYTFGSSIASCLFECIREENQEMILNDRQFELMNLYLKNMTVGFIDKLAILNNPEQMKLVTIPDISEKGTKPFH